MMGTDSAGKVLAQTTSILEKSTEVQFFLHLFCISTYLEIALFIIKKPSLLQIGWGDIEHIEPGKVIWVALGYFFLMGYAIRLAYALFIHGLSWLQLKYLTREESAFEKSGKVSMADVLASAYARKDSELYRLLETHKEESRKDRNETRKIAYLFFAAGVLGLFSYKFVPDNIVSTAFNWFIGFAGWATTGAIGLLILPLPCMLIWIDARKDDFKLYHPPLFAELEEKKKNLR
jgi:hypothetical protein